MGICKKHSIYPPSPGGESSDLVQSFNLFSISNAV
jgi:hypothetical protein